MDSEFFCNFKNVRIFKNCPQLQKNHECIYDKKVQRKHPREGRVYQEGRRARKGVGGTLNVQNIVLL